MKRLLLLILFGFACLPVEAQYSPRIASFSEQTTGDANVTWNAGKTTLRQTAALTANRTGTLPAASGYSAGTIILYTDRLTSGAFGVAWSPAGSDTLNGAGSSVTVFTAGGTARFETDGVSAWTQLDTHPYSPTFATSAQAITGTSTTAALNPANIPFGVFGMSWKIFDATQFNSWFSNSGNSGSGATSVSNASLEETSGATASSYHIRDTGNNVAGLSPSTSALTAGLNFDKMMGFVTTVRLISGTTNGITRLSLGNTVAASGSGNTGKLAGKGIGIEVRNAALYGAVHDGTTYASATLSTTLTINGFYNIAVFRSGSGSFDFYVNGVFAATITGGPTGTSSSHTSKVIFASDNGGDAVAQDALITDLKLFQGL